MDDRFNTDNESNSMYGILIQPRKNMIRNFNLLTNKTNTKSKTNFAVSHYSKINNGIFTLKGNINENINEHNNNPIRTKRTFRNLSNLSDAKFYKKPPSNYTIYQKSQSVKKTRGSSKLPVKMMKIDDNIRKINELQDMLKTTTIENQKLKNLSKEILMEQNRRIKMGSTVHSFYQNVVLPDNEQNSELLKNNITELKTKIAELQFENDTLKSMNEKLKSKLIRYREFLSRKLKSENSINEEIGLTKNDILRNQIMKKTRRNTLNDETSSTSSYSVNVPKVSKENIFLDMLGGSLKKMAKTNTLFDLISKLHQEIQILLKICKIGMFIVDPNLHKLYLKENGKVHLLTFHKTPIYFVLDRNTECIIKPIFIPLEPGKSSMRDNKTIVVPIFGKNSKLKSELYMTVQIESGTEIKTNRENESWVNFINE